jgi:hypothetical protein
MDSDEFLKAQYESEIGRRYQLSGSISMPIGVLTIVGGALLAMAQALRLPLEPALWFTLAAILAGAACAIAVGYYLFRFQLGHDYHYVATAKQIEDYRNELLAYYERKRRSTAGVEDEVIAYIRSEMIASAHANALANDRKSAYLNRANVALAMAIGFTFAAAIPYVATNVLTAEQPPRVKASLEVR